MMDDRERDHLFGLLERLVKLNLILVSKEIGTPYSMKYERDTFKEIDEWMSQYE